MRRFPLHFMPNLSQEERDHNLYFISPAQTFLPSLHCARLLRAVDNKKLGFACIPRIRLSSPSTKSVVSVPLQDRPTVTFIIIISPLRSNTFSELSSCVKVDVEVLGLLSRRVRTVSVEVKQQ